MTGAVQADQNQSSLQILTINCLVTGQGLKSLTWALSSQYFVALNGSIQPSLVWVRKISNLKTQSLKCFLWDRNNDLHSSDGPGRAGTKPDPDPSSVGSGLGPVVATPDLHPSLVYSLVKGSSWLIGHRHLTVSHKLGLLVKSPDTPTICLPRTEKKSIRHKYSISNLQ